MLRRSLIAGRRDDHLLVLEVAHDVAHQLVDQFGKFIHRSFREHGRQNPVGVIEQGAVLFVDDGVAALVGRMPDEMDEGRRQTATRRRTAGHRRRYLNRVVSLDLGLIHRRVRPLEDVLARRLIARKNGQPDAGRAVILEHFVTGAILRHDQSVRFSQSIANLLGHERRAGG